MDQDLVAHLVFGQGASAQADLFGTEGDAALGGKAAGEVAVSRIGVDGIVFARMAMAVQAEYGRGRELYFVRRQQIGAGL